MSAIGGVWHEDGAPDTAASLAHVLNAQAVFGIDNESSLALGNAALGRRLTKILPEDAFDRQPITFSGGALCLVADVRLDDRNEVCSILGLSQPEAAEMSDAACLARSFERWGEGCLQRIHGAFAFAVWDARNRTWFLARDPLGKKPLFYVRQPALFAFASMPQGLLALSSVPYEANEELLIQLAELVPRPDTPERQAQGLFSSMQKVPPGHFVRVSKTGVSVHRYWNPTLEPLEYNASGEYEEALREQLDRAVSRALRGTSFVGCQLSGGLDSSSVTASAARLMAIDGSHLTAFTAVPQAPSEGVVRNRFTDETAHASATADMYPNVDHVLVTAAGRSPLDVLPSSFDLYAMPFTNLCNSPWVSAIHAAAKERKLKVLLNGNNGNFSISHDGMSLIPQLASQHRWKAWWHAVRPLHSRLGMSWRAILFRSIGNQLPTALRDAALRWNRARHPSTPELSLLHPELREKRRKLPVAGNSQLIGLDYAKSRLALFTRIDTATVTKGILSQWGIDERDPTSDQRLVEFSLRVPENQWLRNGMPSALLRNAMAGRLPDLVRFEFRRGLQAVDWHLALSRDLSPLQLEIEALAASSAASARLDVPRMRKLVEDWPKSGWHISTNNLQYRVAFLRALSAGYFLRRAEAMQSRKNRG